MKVKQRRLITLGTGAGYAFHGKCGASHLIEIDDVLFLLDCGEGAAGRLNQMGKTESISYIFLTHLHTDHTSGLFPLIQNMIIDRRQRNLDIYMPDEGITAFQEMQKTCYLIQQINSNMGFDIVYHSIEGEFPFKGDGFTIRAWYSDHFSDDKKRGLTERPAFGFTIDTDGNRLIYTGDVDSAQCFKRELTAGATLICEAFHINFSEIIKLAGNTELKKVILTHSAYANDREIEEYCKDNNYAILAKDGMEFTW